MNSSIAPANRQRRPGSESDMGHFWRNDRIQKKNEF
jgi:hypothetical protein